MMAFCIQCGARIADGSRFCSQCGASQEAAPVVTAAPVMTVPAARIQDDPYDPADDRVMLLSLGTCDSVTAALLLQRTCGYTEADARLIALSAPITLAQNLTAVQSAVLAQALAEYGMEVTVFDGTDYRAVTPVYDTVYNTTGGFLTQVANVLGLIGVGNRLARNMIRREAYPYTFRGTRPPMMTVPRRYASARPTPMPRVSMPRPRVNDKLPRATTPIRPAPARPAPMMSRPTPAAAKLPHAMDPHRGPAPAPARPAGKPMGSDAKLGSAIGPKGRR